MDVDEQAKKIKDWAKRYAEKKGIGVNPDEERVDEVVKGLAARQAKFGKRYCPCRIMTGDAGEDKKIICPCVYQEDEVREHGMCHCRLFSAKKTSEGASIETET